MLQSLSLSSCWKMKFIAVATWNISLQGARFKTSPPLLVPIFSSNPSVKLILNCKYGMLLLQGLRNYVAWEITPLVLLLFCTKASQMVMPRWDEQAWTQTLNIAHYQQSTLSSSPLIKFHSYLWSNFWTSLTVWLLLFKFITSEKCVRSVDRFSISCDGQCSVITSN